MCNRTMRRTWGSCWSPARFCCSRLRRWSSATLRRSFPRRIRASADPEVRSASKGGKMASNDRRKFLGAGAAGVMMAAAGSALAQPSPAQPQRVKGPRVWLDLDQKELDDAYDQSVYAPNQPQITGRYATNSEVTRARLGAPRRFEIGR